MSPDFKFMRSGLIFEGSAIKGSKGKANKPLEPDAQILVLLLFRFFSFLATETAD
jgi:hypothetical protein